MFGDVIYNQGEPHILTILSRYGNYTYVLGLYSIAPKEQISWGEQTQCPNR